MGKRAHGRLVHEVRGALFRAGFMPTRITQLDTPEGLRALRSPGFKVEKHNDGKSVRLFHVEPGPTTSQLPDKHSRLARESSQVKRLADYGVGLEREGFACVALDGQGRPAPYSLWRRTAEAHAAAASRHGKTGVC